MSPNAEIWKSWGVTPEGYDKCDAAMELMLKVVELAGTELAGVVYLEARFQLFTLPERTPDYQEEHRWRKP